MIETASDERFRALQECLTGRGIRRQGRALVAGRKVVGEVLARHSASVLGWVTALDGPEPPEDVAGAEWIRLGPSLFGKLDVSGTHGPLLLAKVPEMPVWRDDAAWPRGCTLFVPFQDPENVGAVVRNAAAFGVARVVLLREAAHPFHPKAARAAGTALFDVVFEVGPTLGELSVGGAPLVAMSADGTALSEVEWPDAFGLVAGVEGPGLPTSLVAGVRARVPIDAHVESLNAATAVAIALYEWRRSVGRASATA